MRFAFAWLLAGFAPTLHAEEPTSPPPKSAVAKAAPAAPSAVADDEFLEFLGSVDDSDREWMEYLAQTDIGTVAKAKKTEPVPTEVKK